MKQNRSTVNFLHSRNLLVNPDSGKILCSSPKQTNNKQVTYLNTKQSQSNFNFYSFTQPFSESGFQNNPLQCAMVKASVPHWVFRQLNCTLRPKFKIKDLLEIWLPIFAFNFTSFAWNLSNFDENVTNFAWVSTYFAWNFNHFDWILKFWSVQFDCQTAHSAYFLLSLFEHIRIVFPSIGYPE